MRRQPQVTLEFELRDGVQTRCAAGMSRHEDQIAGGRPVRGPPQPLAWFERRAALVRPNEREVEVVAGKHEVVGVAAEKSGVELGNEDQAHILQPPIPIQVVLAAPVQRDDLTPDIVARCALTLDLANTAVRAALNRSPSVPFVAAPTRSVTSVMAVS